MTATPFTFLQGRCATRSCSPQSSSRLPARRDLARRARRHGWSLAIEFLGYVAAGVLCVMLLMDHTVIAALVHITIAGIGIAQPNHFSEGFASGQPCADCLAPCCCDGGRSLGSGELRPAPVVCLPVVASAMATGLLGRIARGKPGGHDRACREDRSGGDSTNQPYSRRSYFRAAAPSLGIRGCARAGAGNCRSAAVVGAFIGRFRHRAASLGVVMKADIITNAASCSCSWRSSPRLHGSGG